MHFQGTTRRRVSHFNSSVLGTETRKMGRLKPSFVFMQEKWGTETCTKQLFGAKTKVQDVRIFQSNLMNTVATSWSWTNEGLKCQE